MSAASEIDVAVLDEIIETGRRMLRDGLVIGTAGNISVRVGDHVVITPSGVPYDDITRETLCLLEMTGCQVGGTGFPSAETPLHIGVYRTSDAAAIVHTHAPVSVAVSAVVDELPAIHYAIARFGGHTIPVAEYERFGSDDLAAATASALGGHRGVLLRNHGTVTYGRSLAEAYDLTVLLEWLATAYWRAKSVGDPTIISRAELEEVVAEATRRRYAMGAA
jgi:L-fuculose-phosphate aldolase